MRLSLSGFLFEDGYASLSLGFREFCALAKSIGYDGVELRRTQVNIQTPKSTRRELLATVKEAGLAVTCLTARGLPAARAERDTFLGETLELCVDVECPLLKISADAAWLREAAGRAEKAGVALAANNHVGGALETVADTRAFLAAVGHPNFGLLYDARHFIVGGEDYLGCIGEFAPLTRNILVQSVRPLGNGGAPPDETEWVRALPDEPGVQNWADILRRFKAEGYDGLITVIENGWPVDRREEVARRCAAFLARVWADS